MMGESDMRRGAGDHNASGS